MFKYSNEYGFLYARDLFSDFLTSDYAKYEEESITITEAEFKSILKSKEFKEFLISRESDYSYVSDMISERSFDLDKGLNKTLEIDPGRYEIITNTSSFYETYPTILTRYNDPLFFTHDEKVYLGTIDFIKVISGDIKDVKPIVRGNNSININDFDTIIYLVKPDVNVMISLLKFAYQKNKKIITGLVSNVFDKNIEQKIENIDFLFKELDKKVPGYYEFECEETQGTVVKLIHTLR